MRLGLLILLAALLVAPAGASAATRYASPTGVDTEPCNPTACNIVRAINLAPAGSEVIVNRGSYGSLGSPLPGQLVPNVNVAVHGVAGQARPVITNEGGFVLSESGASLRYVGITRTEGDEALRIDEGEVDQVVARATPGSSAGCGIFGAATVRGSVCEGGGGGVLVSGFSVSFNVVLRNVTARSTGGDGILVLQGGSGGPVLNATNVIADGGSGDYDVHAVGDAAAILDHSNFLSHAGETGGSTSTPTTNSNQTAAPLFANAAAGDYHQLAGSPTIDAGSASSANGALDLDGEARQLGAGTDIGADELVPAAVHAPVNPAPGPDVVAALSTLGFSRSTFAAASQGPSATATARRKRKPKVGTTVTYTLNEAASVAFSVQRRSTGRRVKKGKRRVCVKPTRRNKKKKRCTRYVKLKGSFSLNGAAGTNSFKFSGRLRNRKLGPGRYRLVATPSSGGQKGKSRSRAFRIVR